MLSGQAMATIGRAAVSQALPAFGYLTPDMASLPSYRFTWAGDRLMAAPIRTRFTVSIAAVIGHRIAPSGFPLEALQHSRRPAENRHAS